MKKLLKDNGLSIVFLLLFILTMGGQIYTGLNEHNQEMQEEGGQILGLGAYLTSGHFLQSTFENWESEFLQMGMFVVLTIFLFQKGSSESKTPDTTERVDIILEKDLLDKDAPSPVKSGGLALKLYQNSLSIALFSLFAASFALHAVGGARVYNEEQAEHGKTEKVSAIEYVGTSRFWFESFQNWQSEFLSMGAMVVLSIFLRQKGSPESKSVDSPHGDTGSD